MPLDGLCVWTQHAYLEAALRLCHEPSKIAEALRIWQMRETNTRSQPESRCGSKGVYCGAMEEISVSVELCNDDMWDALIGRWSGRLAVRRWGADMRCCRFCLAVGAAQCLVPGGRRDWEAVDVGDG